MDNQKKALRGIVVSDKMEKGIVVSIEYKIKHPQFKKFIKQSKKVMAHDPENKAKTGNLVDIIPSKPISRKKRYTLLQVVD